MNNDVSKLTAMSLTPSPNTAQQIKKDAVKDAVKDVNTEDKVKVKEDKEEKTVSETRVTSLEEAKKLAKEGNKLLENVQRNLQFKVDDTTKQVVMSIIDKETGEVIRQLPSEEALELAQRMLEANGDPGGIVKDRA